MRYFNVILAVINAIIALFLTQNIFIVVAWFFGTLGWCHLIDLLFEPLIKKVENVNKTTT